MIQERPLLSYDTAEAIYVLLKRNYWSVRCARPSDERNVRDGATVDYVSPETLLNALPLSVTNSPRSAWHWRRSLPQRMLSVIVFIESQGKLLESVKPFGCTCNARLRGRVNESEAVEDIACQIVLEKTWKEFYWNQSRSNQIKWWSPSQGIGIAYCNWT